MVLLHPVGLVLIRMKYFHYKTLSGIGLAYVLCFVCLLFFLDHDSKEFRGMTLVFASIASMLFSFLFIERVALKIKFRNKGMLSHYCAVLHEKLYILIAVSGALLTAILNRFLGW